MLKHRIPLIGITVASLAAGPIFLCGLLVGGWFADPGRAIDPAVDILPAMALIPMAAIAGTALSGIPNFAGAVLMTWLGAHNPGMRLPVAWALVGGAVAAGPVALFDGPVELMVGLGLAGIGCALLCRIGAYRE